MASTIKATGLNENISIQTFRWYFAMCPRIIIVIIKPQISFVQEIMIHNFCTHIKEPKKKKKEENPLELNQPSNKISNYYDKKVD